MQRRPTKPPPAPPTHQPEVSNFKKKIAPPRPPPPRNLVNQLYISNADRITNRSPKSPIAEKIQENMLKIACKYDIASTTLPDANALVDDNETLNLVRLHTFLHQLAKKNRRKMTKLKKENRKRRRCSGAEKQKMKIKTNKRRKEKKKRRK